MVIVDLVRLQDATARAEDGRARFGSGWWRRVKCGSDGVQEELVLTGGKKPREGAVLLFTLPGGSAPI